MERTTQDYEIMVAKTLAPLQEPIYLALQEISTTNVDLESTVKENGTITLKFDTNGLRVLNQNVGYMSASTKPKQSELLFAVGTLLMEHAEKAAFEDQVVACAAVLEEKVNDGSVKLEPEQETLSEPLLQILLATAAQRIGQETYSEAEAISNNQQIH